MLNPMMQSLIRPQIMQNIAPVKQIMSTLRNAGNPQAMFNQMLMQNPRIREVMKYVNDNGGNAEQAFYKMAEQKGVDPNEIISALQN